jgi:hypothetical protein
MSISAVGAINPHTTLPQIQNQPRQLLLPRHRRHLRRLIPLPLAPLRKRRRKLVTSTTTATRIKPAISKAALPRVDGKVRRRL